jgi:putative oxidoreductase
MLSLSTPAAPRPTGPLRAGPTRDERSLTVKTYPTASDGLVPYGALTLRLALGAVYLAHALSKPMLFTMPGTVAFFESNGFPGWAAYPVFAAELLGGVLLLLGLLTRWAAAGLVPVTAGALLVHGPNGWLFINPGGGWEYPAFLLAALASQVLLGGGAHALRVPMRPPAVACGEAHAPRPSWRSRAALSNYLD